MEKNGMQTKWKMCIRTFINSTSYFMETKQEWDVNETYDIPFEYVKYFYL